MTTFTSDDREEAYKKIVEAAPNQPGYEDAVPIPFAGWVSNDLTDEEIEEVWIQALQDEPKVNAGKSPSLANQPFVFFARAILRKAQEK